LSFSRKVTRIGVPGEDPMTLDVQLSVAENIFDLCLRGTPRPARHVGVCAEESSLIRALS
jgi:hypothetical protein